MEKEKNDTKTQQISQKEHYTQLVKDFLRLLEEKNIPALIDLWADDGINYYPYSSGMSQEAWRSDFCGVGTIYLYTGQKP